MTISLGDVFAAATFLVVLAAFVFLRLSIPRLARQAEERLIARVMGFAFTASEEAGKDGSVRKVLHPSAQLTAFLNSVFPVLIQAGIAWAKDNVKIQTQGGGAPGQVSIDPAAIVQMAPKQLRPLAQLFAPMIGPWLQGMFAKGAGAPAGGGGTATGNPFLEGKA